MFLEKKKVYVVNLMVTIYESYILERERERERVFWWGDRKMVLFLDDIKDFYSDMGR